MYVSFAVSEVLCDANQKLANNGKSTARVSVLGSVIPVTAQPCPSVYHTHLVNGFVPCCSAPSLKPGVASETGSCSKTQLI